MFQTNFFDFSRDPTTEKYVRIVYNGQELVLPGCGSAYCNITAFNSVCDKIKIISYL